MESVSFNPTQTGPQGAQQLQQLQQKEEVNSKKRALSEEAETTSSEVTAAAAAAAAAFSPQFSVLSDKAILALLNKRVFIHPFNRNHLNSSSFDVTLGPYYYRQSVPEPGQAIFNPYDEKEVHRVWQNPRYATTMGEWRAANGWRTFEGIGDEERVIWLKPGETILGHTLEFIGGRQSVTTMMKARSSLGRIGIELCKCAGWGDIGYVNRWTMEITNNSHLYSVPLLVGRRVAQIVFFATDGLTSDKASYEASEGSGKYQSAANFDELQRTWTPEMMLPRLFNDPESKKARK